MFPFNPKQLFSTPNGPTSYGKVVTEPTANGHSTGWHPAAPSNHGEKGVAPPFTPRTLPPGIPEVPAPPDIRFFVLVDGPSVALYRRVANIWPGAAEYVEYQPVPCVIRVGGTAARLRPWALAAVVAAVAVGLLLG
jgi:hypothetical protein